LFRDRLAGAVERIRQEPGRIALLILDLDGFKAVNDTYGHTAGDELLIVIAERIRGVVRRGDTVARLGGDEFTILMEDLADDGEAVILAQRVLTAIQQPIKLADAEAKVGCSIGIAYGNQGVHSEELLSAADHAMYQAKAGGKNQYVVSPAEQAATLTR
jgi:diguanylate cyclase (GGDEF)-like protein